MLHKDPEDTQRARALYEMHKSRHSRYNYNLLNLFLGSLRRTLNGKFLLI